MPHSTSRPPRTSRTLLLQLAGCVLGCGAIVLLLVLQLHLLPQATPPPHPLRGGGALPPRAHSSSLSSTPSPQHSHLPPPTGRELVAATAAFASALKALSAALAQARLRGEEAAALQQQLSALKLLQGAPPASAAATHDDQQQQQQQQQMAELLAAGGLSASKQQQQPQQQQPEQQLSGLPRVRLFIGVYTGVNSQPVVEPRYNYTLRRAALRATWMPGTPAQRARVEAQLGAVLRFVIGESPPQQEAALRREQAQHGDLMRLPLQEHYTQLPKKTALFFKAVTERWQPDWIVKVDDDVFLNPSRLVAAMGQWDRMTPPADYVGCMKHGVPWRQPGTRWFEPRHLLFGATYPLHAYGSLYAVRGTIARDVIAANFQHLRLLANEDVSLGLWMLAAKVEVFEDMRLCSRACTPVSIGVQRNECAGLCDPLFELPLLHANPNCSGPPPAGPMRYHASYPEHTAFEQMWVP